MCASITREGLPGHLPMRSLTQIMHDTYAAAVDMMAVEQYQDLTAEEQRLRLRQEENETALAVCKASWVWVVDSSE